MELSENRIKELNARLVELSLQNFEMFCKTSGVDKTRAYICLLKSNGKSIRAIERILGIPRSTVGFICKKCPTLLDGNNQND